MSSATPEGPGTPGPAGGPAMAHLDHGDTGPNMMAAAFTMWTIALIFVLLRFYTRTRIVHVLGISDWFIALSLIAAGGFCVSLAIQVKHGMGKHIWDIDSPTHFAPMMEAWWFSLLCYVLTLALTKVSICLLYLTIFTFEWARRACYVVLFVVVVTNLWALATTLTYCIPLQATWDPFVVASFCQSQDAWWANTGLVIATDVMIFLLPIPLVLPLKLPRRQKLIIVGIFGVGLFVCLVSLIRLIILIQAKNSTEPDFTHTGTDLTYWTVIEVHTAIVVACVMTLKPLAARWLPGFLASRRCASNSSKEGSGGSSGSGAGVGGDGPPLTIGSRPSRRLERLGGEDVVMGEFEGEGGGEGGGKGEKEGKELASTSTLALPSDRNSRQKGGEGVIHGHGRSHSP